MTPEHPTAFVTYAQRDPDWTDERAAAWRQEVHAFAAVLRRYGIDTKVDLFSLHERGVDWSRFGPRAIRESDWVIAAVSSAWRDRYEGGNEPTRGAGAVAEADALISIFQDDQSEFREKLVLVFLPSMQGQRVPTGLHGVHRFVLGDFSQDSLEDLLRLFTNQPRYPAPPLGRVPRFAAESASSWPDDVGGRSALVNMPPVRDPIRDIDEQMGALREALRQMKQPDAGDGPQLASYRAWHRLQEDLSNLEAVRAEIVFDPDVQDRSAPSGPHPGAFEAEVAAAFGADGWEIAQAGSHDTGFDFIARRANEIQLVEVKARRRLDSHDVTGVLEQLVPAARKAGAVPVLAVPSSSVSPQLLQAIADTGVRLLQFRPE